MLKNIIRKIFPNRQKETNKLEAQKLKWLVRAVMTTHPDEIGCEECFQELDRFVEIQLAGKDAAEAMPLVQDHLDRCLVCKEEFEALMVALRALA